MRVCNCNAENLLVEDNEMNRDMLSRRLVRNGFEVVMAVNGQEGVDMTASEKPDLVLMDMSLPVMDGWEATRRLKADDATKAIPVIALTAHAMECDREQAMQAGCDDFDTKPIELPRLLGKINALLAEMNCHAVRTATPSDCIMRCARICARNSWRRPPPLSASPRS